MAFPVDSIRHTVEKDNEDRNGTEKLSRYIRQNLGMDPETRIGDLLSAVGWPQLRHYTDAQRAPDSLRQPPTGVDIYD